MNLSQGIIPIDQTDPSAAALGRLAKHLALGGVAVLPTETRYALSADATNPDAIAMVRRIKGRTDGKPLSVFLADLEAAARWGISVPAWAASLVEVLFPGPLTLVLPTRTPVFQYLGTRGSVGVRISAEPIIHDLCVRLGRPLLATSANPSGRSLSTARENDWIEQLVADDNVLWAKPHYYLRYTPSTVIDCCGTGPVLLRDGAVPRSVWENVLQGKRVWPRAKPSNHDTLETTSDPSE